MPRNYTGRYSHVEYYSWNFTCEISYVKCRHTWNFPCERSYVKFHIWSFTCDFSPVNSHMGIFTYEISHVKIHMWNFTCEKSHVKFYMRRITCEISHVKFHMWNHIEPIKRTKEKRENFLTTIFPICANVICRFCIFLMCTCHIRKMQKLQMMHSLCYIYQFTIQMKYVFIQL